MNYDSFCDSIQPEDLFCSMSSYTSEHYTQTTNRMCLLFLLFVTHKDYFDEIPLNSRYLIPAKMSDYVVGVKFLRDRVSLQTSYY